MEPDAEQYDQLIDGPSGPRARPKRQQRQAMYVVVKYELRADNDNFRSDHYQETTDPDKIDQMRDKFNSLYRSPDLIVITPQKNVAVKAVRKDVMTEIDELGRIIPRIEEELKLPEIAEFLSEIHYRSSKFRNIYLNLFDDHLNLARYYSMMRYQLFKIVPNSINPTKTWVLTKTALGADQEFERGLHIWDTDLSWEVMYMESKFNQFSSAECLCITASITDLASQLESEIRRLLLRYAKYKKIPFLTSYLSSPRSLKEMRDAVLEIRYNGPRPRSNYRNFGMAIIKDTVELSFDDVMYQYDILNGPVVHDPIEDLKKWRKIVEKTAKDRKVQRKAVVRRG